MGGIVAYRAAAVASLSLVFLVGGCDSCHPTDAICGDLPDKFIGRGGRLLKVIEELDGSPTVFFTSGRSLLIRHWDGAHWTDPVGLVHRLPDDVGGDAPVRFGFGLGFDAMMEDDGQPIVCLVEAGLHAGEIEANGTGTLRVLKRQPSGAWNQLGTMPEVRPIGCSLSRYEFGLLIAYVQREALGFTDEALNGRPWVASILPPFGVFPFLPLRFPEKVPVQQVADLTVSGFQERFYYAYRLPYLHAVGHPGYIVAGFFDRGHPQHVVAQVTDPFSGYRVPIFKDQNANLPPEKYVTLGAGPVIAATAQSVELAYQRTGAIYIPPLGPPFNRPGSVTYYTRGLTYLSAPNPGPNGEFHFSAVYRDEKPGASVAARDGFSPSDVSPPQIFHARPQMARSRDGTNVYLSYPRPSLIDDDEPGAAPAGGGDEVAVVRRPLITAEPPDVDVIDSRVGPTDRGQDIVAHSVTDGKQANAYQVVFRNPLTDEIEFARRFVNPTMTSDTNVLCPDRFRKVRLTEEQLNLAYIHFDPPTRLPLIDPSCPGFANIPEFITTPDFKFPIDKPDLFAHRETLLRDQLVGALIRDGRGLLKGQQNVCLPNQLEILTFPYLLGDGCDPGLDWMFTPQPGPRTWRSVRPAPFLVGGDTQTVCAPPDQPCSCGTGQLVHRSDGTFACVRCPTTFPCTADVCPDGAAYVTTLGHCGVCPFSRVVYPGLPVGVRPHQIEPTDAALCAGCGAQFPDNLAKGEMPTLISADGLSCVQCTDGSALLPCLSDEDCTIFGSTDDFRCGLRPPLAASAAAPTQVCLKKCTSDAQCPRGTCTDGTCVGPDQHELAGPALSVCRPLGCDQCWHNDYCDTSADCPFNHLCSTELPFFDEVDAPTPLCLARPVLGPRLINAVLPLFPPDQQQAIKASIDGVREQFLATIRPFRIPHGIEIEIPGPNGHLNDLATQITDIRIILRAADDHDRQGGLALRVDLGDVLIDGLSFVDRLENVSVELRFQPFVQPHVGSGVSPGDAGSGFSGIGFSLVDTAVGADIPILQYPHIGIPVGGYLKPVLGPRMGPLVTQILLSIMDSLGHPGTARCVFVADDGAPGGLPQQCAEGPESEQIAHIRDGELDIILRTCTPPVSVTPSSGTVLTKKH